MDFPKIKVTFYRAGEKEPWKVVERHLRPREGEWIRIEGDLYKVHSVVFSETGESAEVTLTRSVTVTRYDEGSE